MVSKSQIKLIKSLSSKKHRQRERLFVVEGIKGIQEFLNSDFEVFYLLGTQRLDKVEQTRFYEASPQDLSKISSLSTAPEYLAVFRMRDMERSTGNALKVVLDGVRDPGNLGTIIRLCDWFGVKDLICSRDTVDCYNPKVVQASMGSLSRINVSYEDLKEVLTEPTAAPVYGTLLEGQNIYSSKLESNGYVIFGNEANGISKNLEEMITHKIKIPQYGKDRHTESLNVATAAAITLAEFRRQEFTEK